MQNDIRLYKDQVPEDLAEFFEPELCGRCYVCHLVEVFREVRRVLRPDGVFWLNVGDSYARGRQGRADGGRKSDDPAHWKQSIPERHVDRGTPEGYKDKDLIGIPWMLALALRKDGWYLRQEIIWCLSGGAWVYARTQKGDMPVMVKDLVRLDPSTIRLWNGSKWTRVLGWGPSTDDSERIELVLRSGERIGCTGGHLWPTQRGTVASRDLRKGDEIALCTLPEPEGAALPPYLTEDALWLIGLYLAEGSRSDETIQLSLHADEQRWLPRLEAIAVHYGGTCSHTLDGNNLSVRMWGRVLNALIETFVAPGDAHAKHMKVAAWMLPSSALRCIAEGYLDGDGSVEESANRIRLGFCRNYALERDLRTLAARLGATLTLRPTFSKGFGRKFPSFKGEWRWSRSGHSNEKSRGEILEIRASRARQFWDLSVEDDPYLFALASGVLTHNCKPNVMPESVRDRPTRSHEQVFLLTKNRDYFYDQEAEREPGSASTFARFPDASSTRLRENGTPTHQAMAGWEGESHCGINPGGRNLRTVWKINPQPYRGAHFAVFPMALPTRCIKLGTSEHGACSACGAPFERIVERVVPEAARFEEPVVPNNTPHQKFSWEQQRVRDENPPKTIGWEPSCKCKDAGLSPCIVLDPFLGSGTTVAAAIGLGRAGFGIEINPEYEALIMERKRGPEGFASQREGYEAMMEAFGDA